MEDFYINSTSQTIYNFTSYYFNYFYFDKLPIIMYVATCIIIGIGLPLTLVAIYALYSLVQNDHVAPIYVINLLISDLIQLCCMIVEVAPHEHWMTSEVFFCIYFYGLVASVGFMACVALERYLVIACPLWYHFRRTIKVSVVVCVMVWALAPFYFLTFFYLPFPVTDTIFAVFLLLPFPLLIFFLGGTLKALSASHVPTVEKRRIVGTLVLVLLIYMLLFLPSIILPLVYEARYYFVFRDVSLMFLELSPLADLVLYVFMRKGTIDRLLASVCCSRMDSNEISSSTV